MENPSWSKNSFQNGFFSSILTRRLLSRCIGRRFDTVSRDSGHSFFIGPVHTLDIQSIFSPLCFIPVFAGLICREGYGIKGWLCLESSLPL